MNLPAGRQVPAPQQVLPVSGNVNLAKYNPVNKKYFLSLTCLFIALLVTFSSCAQTKDSTIIGTWIIDSADVKAPPDLPLNSFDKKTVVGQVYTFNADGSFLKDNLPGGNYSITKEGNRVFLTFLMGQMGITTRSEIIELTQKTLVYKMDYGNLVFTIHSIRKL